MDSIRFIILLCASYFCVTFTLGEVLHILRDLQPPHYLYPHINNEYVPPLESVDPATTTRATTRRPLTTTEFFLPEIIVNKYTEEEATNVEKDIAEDEYFNGYPYPTIPHPVYLPVTTAKTTRQPIINDPLPTRLYLPPPNDQDEIPRDAVDPNSDQYIPSLQNKQPKNLFRTPTTIQQSPTSSSTLSSLRMELNQLRCLASPQNGYFKALLTFAPNSLDHPPVILVDGNPSSDLHNVCGIRMVRTKVLVNIRFAVFQQCGVESCGEQNGLDGQKLCVRLSFPQIRGMMTDDDGTLTLQCKVQELVAAQTHSLRVGVNKER